MAKHSSIKPFIQGLLIGVVFGTTTTFIKRKAAKQHKNWILDQVKSLFLREGPIEAAWIEDTPAPYSDNHRNTKAYFGGVTRKEDGELTQYQFAADAHSGELLDIFKI